MKGLFTSGLVGSEYKSFITYNFGNTWTDVSSNDPDSFAVGYPHFINWKTGFCISGYGIIYKSIDGGNYWIKTGKVPHNLLKGDKVQFTNENTGYSSYLGKGPYKTTDGGKTWFLIQNGLPELVMNVCSNIDMYFSDDKNGWLVMYCYGNFYYYRTEDGGKNWGKLEFNLPSCNLAYIKGVDKYNLTLWPYNGAKCVYRTTNGGGPYSGINEKIENEKNFNIYPNPVNNALVIRFSDVQNYELKIELINMQGQVVLTDKISKSEHIVNMSSFTSGIYLLKIIDVKGVMVERIIKK